MQLLVHTPINSLSLGSVGVNFLRAIYKAGHEVGLFIVGQPDFSSYKVDKPFVDWIQDGINRRFEFLKKDIPVINNWHINGSERVYSSRQILTTYHETDSMTPVEIAIVKNQFKTLFCGGYSAGVARKYGAENVGGFDLGLDEDFFPTDKKYFNDRLHWGLCGKWEFRKNTAKIIKLWADKYGNNHDHSLTLLVTNPFFGKDENEATQATANLLNQALGGKRYWNINFLPRLRTNSELNDYFNSIDIDLSGASFAESWGLPAFTSTCLGKWSIVNNYAGHKAWANEENSILIEPEGFIESHDGTFFKKGSDYNIGMFSVYGDRQLQNAFERAEKLAKQKNQKGLDLGLKMTYSRSVEQILTQL